MDDVASAVAVAHPLGGGIVRRGYSRLILVLWEPVIYSDAMQVPSRAVCLEGGRRDVPEGVDAVPLGYGRELVDVNFSLLFLTESCRPFLEGFQATTIVVVLHCGGSGVDSDVVPNPSLLREGERE